MPDLDLWIWITPGLILGFAANWYVQSVLASVSQHSAPMSGFAISRHLLDRDGLLDTPVEITPGTASDHYSFRERVIRLSPAVYHGRSLAALGIAAHEVGHALQHATGLGLISIRSTVAALAAFGGNAGLLIALGGATLSLPAMELAGVASYAAVVLLQLLTLPLELDASRRATQRLIDQEILTDDQLRLARRVLAAAAFQPLAATLQSVFRIFSMVARLFPNSPPNADS